MEKWKFFTLPGLELPPPLVVQPVASLYTDWEEEILKINCKNKILNRRILMNINKIRLQHNLVDNNTKIMNIKACGKWGNDIQYSLTVLA
jgi:hypothetical protein